MQSLAVAEQQKEEIWGAETRKSFSRGSWKGWRGGSKAISSCFVALTEVPAPCVLTSSGQPLNYEGDLEKTTSCSMSSEWHLTSCGLLHPRTPTHPGPAVISAPTSAGHQPAEAMPAWGSGPRLQGPCNLLPGSGSPHSTVTLHNSQQEVKKISKDNSVSAMVSEICLKLVSRCQIIQEGWERVRHIESMIIYDWCSQKAQHTSPHLNYKQKQ